MSEVLRAGYKLTEVGVIPTGWKVHALNELCTSILDCHHSTPVWTKAGNVVLRNQNIRYGKLDLTFPSFTDEHNFIERTRRAVPTIGDLVITREAPMGEVCAIPKDLKCCLGQRMVLLRTNQDVVNSVYLLYCLQSTVVQSAISVGGGTGSTVSNLRIPVLKGLRIPFPALEEQRAIAAALSDIDTLLAKLDTLIAKKRNIKQATMQQLLTGQTRLPGFSGEWEVKRVEEFGEVVTGGTPRTDVQEYWGEGFPWITPTDISIGRDMHASERSITPSGLNSIRSLPKNTVLVTCIASIGKNAILKTEGACNQQINAVIPNQDHCVEFLYYIFEASKQYLQANAGTSATSMVSKAVFSKMNFLVPSLPEQTAIAAVFSDMDTELATLETRRDKTLALKQGMMQELLTGRIRLV
jgi:type I restriction enzyme, S subunit